MSRTQRQPAAHRRLRDIQHVQIVGPALGPIFPRMAAGIRADESCLPIGRRSLLVMPLQRCGVILSLVTEQRTKRVEVLAVGDQAIPIVMSALVTEMTEQRTVRFLKIRT